MSNIDKRALREAAEKATPGPWYVHDKPCEDGNYGIDTSDKEFLAEAVVWWGFSRQSIWREEDAKHIAAANPATVLALLDELEAKDKRIAELEAREVKLPNPHAHLIWIQAGHAPDDYWDDVAVSHSEKDKCCDGSDRYPVYALWEIKEALSAIGINIAAAGKGEAS
ncbi:ead/Ea22-like family protein [Enterobacter roggenkampii]|uniref:ead/Ea22-like family protein n=1 Tax=Enterobacter roggenkampii TaxID=1812935 RepID=UPI002FD2DE36